MSGVAEKVRPGGSQDRLPPLWRIVGVWRRRTPELGLGLLVSLTAFGVGLALLGASALRLAGAAAGVIAASALLLRGLGIGRVLLRYAERLVTHDAMFKALADLRVWFFRRLAATSAGGLGFRRSGDMLSRLVGDVEALDGLYLRILVPLAGALLALPVLVLLALHHGPGLAATLGLLFLLAAFVLPALAARLVRRDSQNLSQRASGLRVAVLDLASGLREVRAFNAEGRMLALVQARESALLSLQMLLARRTALAGALSFLCQQLAVLAVLASLGGLLFGRIAPVFAASLLFVVFAAFELAGGLVRAGALYGHASEAAARIVAAGDGAPEAVTRRPDAASQAVPRDNALRLRGVGFRWQADRPAVFEQLTLDIAPGAKVALLGPSGSGKSSLAALLLRVAVPQTGGITLGGVDLAAIEEAELRRRIAWLSQSTHLFDDTIRANLLLGRPDADEAALWQALDRAAIGEMVRGLPDGLDTWLGEAGTRVSGGQGRRIALARVLLSHAPIVILDEPCAGLDAETEQGFLRTLNEATEGRTVILIAHRLTGVERLDRIWRLSGGHAAAAAA